MNIQSLSNKIKQELQPSNLLPTLIAGLITGLMVVVVTLSFSVLIFAGDLARFRSMYISFALFGSALGGLIIALRSSSYVVSAAQSAPAAINAIIVAAIASQIPASATDEEKFITIVVALGFITLFTGLIIWLMGKFRLGNIVRFMPYSVLAGFLVGTGWLLFNGSFSVLADVSLSWQNLSTLFSAEVLNIWSTGIVFAIVLLILSRIYRHWALIPSAILSALALFYLVLTVTQTSLADATTAGWLLETPENLEPWRPLSPMAFLQVDWSLILPQISGTISIALLAIITVLLNASSLEVISRTDIDANQELKVAGLANCLVGLSGGLVGFTSLSLSSLQYKIGARSRLVGIIAAMLSAIVLILGPTMVALVPKFLLGGLLAFVGLSLLVEWLYDGWFKLSFSDYLMMVVILGIVIFAGFLQGVGYGIILAVILFVINYSRTAVTRNTLSRMSYSSRVHRLASQERMLTNNGDRIYILQLQGLLFFGTANRLATQIQERLMGQDTPPLGFIVLDFRLVTGLDSSAIISFVKLKQIAEKEGIKLVFTSLTRKIKQQLQQGNVLVDSDSICQVFPDLDRGLEWCEDQFLQESKLRRSRSMPLFLQLKATFPKPELVDILLHKYLVPIKLAKGETLFNKGDKYQGLYFLETGQVSLLNTSSAKDLQRVATYNRGTVIGEQGLYQNSPHRLTAVADDKSRLYFLDLDSLARMEREHPQLASGLHRYIMRSLTERLDRLDREIDELLK